MKTVRDSLPPIVGSFVMIVGSYIAVLLITGCTGGTMGTGIRKYTDQDRADNNLKIEKERHELSCRINVGASQYTVKLFPAKGAMFEDPSTECAFSVLPLSRLLSLEVWGAKVPHANDGVITLYAFPKSGESNEVTSQSWREVGTGPLIRKSGEESVYEGKIPSSHLLYAERYRADIIVGEETLSVFFVLSD